MFEKNSRVRCTCLYIQQSCAYAARSSSSIIVAFGVGSVGCKRGIAAPAYPLNTVLQSRHASCAPEKSSALCQLILQFHILPGQPLQRGSQLLMNCSQSVFCHLGVSGMRCLSIDPGPPTNTGSSSETARLPRKLLHQYRPQPLARIPRIST